MSTPRQGVVSRNYSYAPEECARALAFLLKTPVSKKAAHPGGPEGARKEFNDSRAKDILRQH
jgi:hypothetical protein